MPGESLPPRELGYRAQKLEGHYGKYYSSRDGDEEINEEGPYRNGVAEGSRS